MNDGELIQQAREAAHHASVPYSRFPVGAAVQCDEGRVFRGCNIESASYGLTICAERVAIFSAVAQGARPTRLAVTCVQGNASTPGSLMPCGACRQVMLDHMGPDAAVIVNNVGVFTVAELLPHGFQLPG